MANYLSRMFSKKNTKKIKINFRNRPALERPTHVHVVV